MITPAIQKRNLFIALVLMGLGVIWALTSGVMAVRLFTEPGTVTVCGSSPLAVWSTVLLTGATGIFNIAGGIALLARSAR